MGYSPWGHKISDMTSDYHIHIEGETVFEKRKLTLPIDSLGSPAGR